MQQTVYVDILVFVNTIVNFYILLISGRISHTRISKYRILFGGVLGGLMSLTVLLPELPIVLSLLIKIAGSLILVFVSYEWQNLKRFFIRFLWFLGMNFIFAGAVLFCCFVLRTPLIYYNNSNFYFDISAPFIVVIATLTYILFSFVLKSSQKPVHLQKYYNIKIFKSNEVVSCTALSDTGNSLKDVFTGTPVVVANIDTVSKIIPDSYRQFFISNDTYDCCSEGASDVRLIPYEAVSGKGFLKAFRCDELKIYTEESEYRVKNGYVAVYNGKLSDGNYEAIINPEIFDIAGKVA